MTEYWGELPPTAPSRPHTMVIHTANMDWVPPIPFTNSSDKIHFPLNNNNHNEDHPPVNTWLVSDMPIGCPLMVQTIKLLKLLRQLNDNTLKDEVTVESIPQLMPLSDNRFDILKLKDKAVMNEKAVKEMMRRAVIIISVFYGFDNMNESVLDLLVDLLAKYMYRLCQTIRTTSDSLELKSGNDFVDVIDRVFHDMNVSDFESLRQYESDLLIYNQNLMKEVVRRIESKNSTNTSDVRSLMDTNSDNSPQLSVTSQPESREEPTLSLKSLLSSYKSDEVQENEQFFGLTSPMTNASNKSN